MTGHTFNTVKKNLLIGLMLLPVAAFADAVTNWEAQLTRDWKALTSEQRAALRNGERIWIKWKDTLNMDELQLALRNRCGFLESDKAGDMALADSFLEAQSAQQQRIEQEIADAEAAHDQQNLRVKQGNLQSDPDSVQAPDETEKKNIAAVLTTAKQWGREYVESHPFTADDYDYLMTIGRGLAIQSGVPEKAQYAFSVNFYLGAHLRIIGAG
jgi:hypothetical protein